MATATHENKLVEKHAIILRSSQDSFTFVQQSLYIYEIKYVANNYKKNFNKINYWSELIIKCG